MDRAVVREHWRLLGRAIAGAGQEEGWCPPAPVQSRPNQLITASLSSPQPHEIPVLQLCPSTTAWARVGL